MPRSIRGRRRGVPRAAGVLLMGIVLLVPLGRVDSTPATPLGARNEPRRHPIIVNSPLATVADPLKINLARALEIAARDPRDNVIRFDPVIFHRSTTLTLGETIIPAANLAGKDWLEGPVGEASITLDASECPDAGFVVSDRGWLGLSNITLRGGRQRGVLLKDRAQARLDQVTIRDSQGPAIALFGQARVELTDCRLQSAQTHGLEIHGSSAAVLRSVEITDCHQSAVAAFERSSLRAERSRFERNGHWNLVLTGQVKVEIEGCRLAGARFANVDASDSAQLDIASSMLEAGQRFGLFATGHSRSNVRFSQIRDHGSRGIEMQGHASLVLEGAEVDANRDYGVILFEQCSIRAAASKFTRNQGHGVSLRGQASGSFDTCLFAGNRYSGLGCLDARDGGKVQVTQSIFQGNGMRPIYRGPMHLDPLVPTPLLIDDHIVECLAEPDAVIELYLDRAGEASRYLKTIEADSRGRFLVSRSDVPPDWVMSATATSKGSTSEFNVIAGSVSPELMGALLARTGPLSDAGGDTDLDGGLRRWKPGTHLVLHIPNPPTLSVERYTRFVAEQVVHWTGGALTAELRIGPAPTSARDAVVVPVEYMPPETPALLGRGGVTFMRWDSNGYFVSPMKILLATGKDAQETCPRVLAHEFGHVLGLSHARVGLLSRMQGSMPPTEAFVNDFSPMLTFYDVLALHVLHQSEWHQKESATLRQLVQAGLLPGTPDRIMASARPGSDQPTYSPLPSPEPQAPSSPRSARPRN